MQAGSNMSDQRLAFPLSIPFVEELGLELWAFADGKAELRVDLADAHLNSWAVAHGGVLMTMLDVAMAHAARSVVSASAAARSVVSGNDAPRGVASAEPPATTGAASPLDHGPGVATIEMKTTFMRPAEGRLRALGTLLHRTSTMAFTEGSVFNEHGQLCAHATGTFKYLRALPTTGRHAKTLQINDKEAPP